MPDRSEPPDVIRRSRHEVPSAAHEALGLWVRGVGLNSAARPHDTRQDRQMGCFAALYITRGHGWFESPPTGRRSLKTGTLAWLFPEVRHSYGPIDEPWAEQWVLFGGTVADRYRHEGFLSHADPLVQVGTSGDVADLFAQLQSVFLDSGPLSVPMAAALTHQLIVAVHGIQTGLTGPGDAADPAIALALKTIDRDAMNGLTPAELARRTHVGYSTLRRRFKEQTGYSVKEYILRVQLRRAKELLALSEQPVAAVAQEVGFDDPYYFSRLFKDREGVPPSVFRENLKEMR